MKWMIMAYSPSVTTPYLYEIDDEINNVKNSVQSIMSVILNDNKESYGIPNKIKVKDMVSNGLYQLTAIYATTDDVTTSISVVAKSEKTLSIKFPFTKTFPNFDDSSSEITDCNMIVSLMS